MTQESQKDEKDENRPFESISDIDVSYRVTKTPASSSASSSSSSTCSEEEDMERQTVEEKKKTEPNKKKLPEQSTPLPPALRPSKLNMRKAPSTSPEGDEQEEDKGNREMKNLISLWEAQKRAKRVHDEVQKEETDDENDSSEKEKDE